MSTAASTRQVTASVRAQLAPSERIPKAASSDRSPSRNRRQEYTVRNAPPSSSAPFQRRAKNVVWQRRPAKSVGSVVVHRSLGRRVHLHNADGVGRRGRVRDRHHARVGLRPQKACWSRARHPSITPLAPRRIYSVKAMCTAPSISERVLAAYAPRLRCLATSRRENREPTITSDQLLRSSPAEFQG